LLRYIFFFHFLDFVFFCWAGVFFFFFLNVGMEIS